MATIKFKNIPKSDIENIRAVFEFIADGKRQESIDEDKLASLLGEKYKTKFLWATKEENEEWLKRWQATPVKSRFDDPSLKRPWDFGSWVDAFNNAEVNLDSILVHETGKGELKFTQLAWPSGGIEATEELITIFNGCVISNDAT